jgi:hypothetical protein
MTPFGSRWLAGLAAALLLASPAIAAPQQPAKKPAQPAAQSEAARFKLMRTMPFYAHMSDAELRRQKLPPGFKRWEDVAAMNQQLQGYQAPRPTPEPPQPVKGKKSAQAMP